MKLAIQWNSHINLRCLVSNVCDCLILNQEKGLVSKETVVTCLGGTQNASSRVFSWGSKLITLKLRKPNINFKVTLKAGN